MYIYIYIYIYIYTIVNRTSKSRQGVYMAYIPDHREPQGSYTTTSKFVHEYSRDIWHISSLV